MKIEWSHIISASLGYVLVLILKTILDFNVAPFLVKVFHFLPVRTFLRRKHIDISGYWEQEWEYPENKETSYTILERKSLAEIKQLGNYVYGEFSSGTVNYYLFGKVKDSEFITGDWYDAKDSLGYFGSFELKIMNSSLLEGMWIGHSKRSTGINGHRWAWTKQA